MTTEYEITYLVDPSLSDDARGSLDTAIDSLITDAKGVISNSAPSLRRRLMYPIYKNVAAFVRTVQVELPSDAAETIRAAIKKQAGVLRLSLLQTPLRSEVSPDIFTKRTETAKEQAPAKKVTMAEVEEKIEEALKEEVK